jgi:hypothetical protein
LKRSLSIFSGAQQIVFDKFTLSEETLERFHFPPAD